jgi:hypothetical protein
VPSITGAAASPPTLPALSVEQLVADVAQAKAPALSGTLTWLPNLGLSALSTLQSELGGSSASTGSGFDPLTLLSGSSKVNVWLGGPKEERLALITGPSSEIDLVRNANQAWLWDSTNQRVEHFVGPASGSSLPGTGPVAGFVPTPQQVASRVLSKISSTTSVTEGPAVYVAGQPAYQLVVTPKEPSTLSSISIAVGSSGPLLGVPLQVAVYARGVTLPALELGFTGSLNLGAPSASEFNFVAPPGSKVVTHQLGPATMGGQPFGSLPTGLGASGTGWATVVHGTSSSLTSASAQAALAAVTTPVQVAGEQARLFSTYLLNVLVMPNGRFYAGFVTPSALEAAASQGA